MTQKDRVVGVGSTGEAATSFQFFVAWHPGKQTTETIIRQKDKNHPALTERFRKDLTEGFAVSAPGPSHRPDNLFGGRQPLSMIYTSQKQISPLGMPWSPSYGNFEVLRR